MKVIFDGTSIDLEEFLEIGEPNISVDNETISVFIGKNSGRKHFIAKSLLESTNIKHSEIINFIKNENEKIYYSLEDKCLVDDVFINDLEVGIKTFVRKIEDDLPKPKVSVELEHIYKGLIINVNNELIEKTLFSLENENLGFVLVDKKNHYYTINEVLFLEDITQEKKNSERVTMNKKYELTDETIEFEGKTLYRIRALKDFEYVTKGDLGGFIESEDNLSHEDNCWVSEDAKVLNKAKIVGDAWVTGNATVTGNAWVSGLALISGHALVKDYAVVSDYSWVMDKVTITDNARIIDNCRVTGNAMVTDNAQISGEAWVAGNSLVKDNAVVKDSAYIKGEAIIIRNTVVEDDTHISHNHF